MNIYVANIKIHLQEDLIKIYEEYLQLLGEEIRELAVIGRKNGWQSKSLKQNALIRNKIIRMKENLNNLEK